MKISALRIHEFFIKILIIFTQINIYICLGENLIKLTFLCTNEHKFVTPPYLVKSKKLENRKNNNEHSE